MWQLYWLGLHLCGQRSRYRYLYYAQQYPYRYCWQGTLCSTTDVTDTCTTNIPGQANDIFVDIQ